MSDYILIPISPTEAARVQMPLALPREDRPAYLAALTPEQLSEAEHVPIPSAPALSAPVPSPASDEDTP